MAYTNGGQHTLMQPHRMPTPVNPDGKVPTDKGNRKANWWDHTGPLAVVFAGGPDGKRGDLVLPVRIPQQPGQEARVRHFLEADAHWHKVDLVRRRKAGAPGRWVYEAHLMVLGSGWSSPAVRQMRDRAAQLDRIGGVDGNVSNLSVVSFPADLAPEGKPVSTEITLTENERARLEKAAKKRRGRARALERSRRATNAGQYGLSKKQAARAARREAQGLKLKAVMVPGGARAARSDGVPKQAFRRDRLSASYRTQRARQAEHAASLAERRRHRARLVAREIIAAHGPVLVVEDCDIRTWYRLWGKRLSQTTPGMLISALKVECEATGGRLVRASTWSTALSQHCMCGERVNKTLRDREHTCTACGLVGKRDLVSAALAAFVRFHDVDDPKAAYLDTTMSRHTQITYSEALEEALRESTTPSPNTPRGAGRVAVPRQRGTSAPQTAEQRDRATPDEPRHMRDHAGTPGTRTACSPQLTLWEFADQVLDRRSQEAVKRLGALRRHPYRPSGADPAQPPALERRGAQGRAQGPGEVRPALRPVQAGPYQGPPGAPGLLVSQGVGQPGPARRGDGDAGVGGDQPAGDHGVRQGHAQSAREVVVAGAGAGLGGEAHRLAQVARAGPVHVRGVRREGLDEGGGLRAGQPDVAVPALPLLRQHPALDEAGQLLAGGGGAHPRVPGQLARRPGPAVQQRLAEDGPGAVGEETGGLGEGGHASRMAHARFGPRRTVPRLASGP
ncbi:hypothetical protein GCM10009802_54340 [Streptomyces synnematoformans]|uniref:Cas12f1-like TNB domain-containing protein n=1 Tax=Streptomyces synnematoformans TaxID=415721 RepID=A0ABN1ZIT4_9ACTN